MAKGIMTVQSTPSPEREDEFNAWYSGSHIPEILKVPGFVSARRYKLRGETLGYLAVYELEADDITAPIAAMRELSQAGGMTALDPTIMAAAPVVSVYDAV